MILSKEDYLDFLKCDMKALGISKYKRSLLKNILSPNPTHDFQKLMRKLEYYVNCKKGFFYKIYILFLKYKYKKKSIKLGFSIPINVFDKGLAIVHYGTIVVNPNVRVGKNCRIHVCVNIGASGGKKEAPQIGDNVYIAPGVKIYGNINIPNYSTISANAVVNKTTEEVGFLLAGIPAKPIKKFDNSNIIKLD